MADTLLRQWTMLRLIPRAPRKIETAALERLLFEEGFEVNRRSIQRDLNTLSTRFPLLCDMREKPYGWCWDADAVLDVPGMDPTTALTFALAERFLNHVLPPATLRRMEPHFRQARGVLDHVDHPGMAHWPEKVRILPRGLKLLAPEIDQPVLDVVYAALLKERCFKAHYQPREAAETTYEVNPLGLVLRDAVTYLVCTLWNYQDVLQLALHRMQYAEILDKPASRPADFDLDAYIAAGHFASPYSGEMVRLEVLFEADAAYHLRETRLSEDQELTDQPDGRVLVKATVRDTGELRWWLLGFEEAVEVLSPEGLL
jgi:predicted DNA-binding transcriptional regulator YafY